jgi:hypothetical protein
MTVTSVIGKILFYFNRILPLCVVCCFRRSEIFLCFGRCKILFVCCTVLREFLRVLPRFSPDLGFGLRASFFLHLVSFSFSG